MSRRTRFSRSRRLKRPQKANKTQNTKPKSFYCFAWGVGVSVFDLLTFLTRCHDLNPGADSSRVPSASLGILVVGELRGMISKVSYENWAAQWHSKLLSHTIQYSIVHIKRRASKMAVGHQKQKKTHFAVCVVLTFWGFFSPRDHENRVRLDISRLVYGLT